MRMLDVTDYSILLNPARLFSVTVFAVGFFGSFYLWTAMRTERWGLRFFLFYIVHHRRQLLKQLFTEGPGYLILPLWLIAAQLAESYLWPLLAAWS